MTSKDLGIPPINCNDEDLLPGKSLPPSSLKITEMTFPTITYHAVIQQRKLLEPPEDNVDKMSYWKRRLAIVDTFELDMRNKYASISMETATPIEKLIKLGADDMAMTAHLLLRRPPYKQEGHFVPQDGFDILGTATEVLVRDMRLKIPELAQWAWKSWVKWYALAIVLAELSTCPSGPKADRAYSVARDAYKLYAPRIADSESGMLWRPITKLMRRVENLRRALQPEVQDSHSYEPSAPFAHEFGNFDPQHKSLSITPWDTNLFDPQNHLFPDFLPSFPMAADTEWTSSEVMDSYSDTGLMGNSNRDMFLDDFNCFDNYADIQWQDNTPLPPSTT